LADSTSDFFRIPLGKGEIDLQNLISCLKRLPNLRQVTLELTRSELEIVRQSLESIQKCW
jgi:sugar phosphate isomerase/epimerase